MADVIDHPHVVVAPEGILVCPVCKESHSCLHHEDVIVRARQCEDGPGMRIVVDAKGNAQSWQLGAVDHEWAGRRNDIEITLWCENCGIVGSLCIMQHKGATYLKWRFAAVRTNIEDQLDKLEDS